VRYWRTWVVRDVLEKMAFSMQKENIVRLDYGRALDVASSCISPERYEMVSSERVLGDCFRIGLLHRDDMVFLSEITERPDELLDDVVGAGEVFLAAKLTLRVDDRRVENLCALLLDQVDSKFDLEKYLALKSLEYIRDEGAEVLKELRISEGAEMTPNFNFVKSFVSIGDKGGVNLIINSILNNDKHDRAQPVTSYKVIYPCGLTHKEELEASLKSDLGSDDKNVANRAFEMRYLIKRDNREKIFKELKYLLRWDDIPRNDSDRLMRYLQEDCGITLAKRAEIHKFNDKTITISKDENSAEITIDEGGEKATLKLSDDRTCDLNVRKKVKIGYATPSGVKYAEELRTDPYLGAFIDRLKLVLDGTTVVDYGCGKGALLGRMNEIEKELGKIHYIGVDISIGNLFLARRTAERHYIADKLKSCRFMKKDELFSEDIDINHVFFVHTLHEIPLKDLPEIIFHLLSKMKAGSRIAILEQRILVEPERDFVTWDADDFDMLFSGFAEVSSHPYETGRGHELINVDMERLDTDVSLESIHKRCLEVYKRKKERVGEERESSDLSEGVRHYLSELYANIDSQIMEYQKSIVLDE
jgi:SAM-dependent methyltransferase